METVRIYKDLLKNTNSMFTDGCEDYCLKLTNEKDKDSTSKIFN